MDKIQCKALLCMGYWVPFPKRRGTRTPTLIKLGPSTNIRATLTWNQIHKVGITLWILCLPQRSGRSLQPCWATCCDKQTWGQRVPPHLRPQPWRDSSKNSQSNPKRWWGLLRLGTHLLPDTPRDRVSPCDPLCPAIPKTLHISIPSNRKLIQTQGEKPPLGPSKTAKQVDTSDSNLCEFKSSTKIGLITWEQCISPVLPISSLVVHFFFFFSTSSWNW